jgi:hypothetical protein
MCSNQALNALHHVPNKFPKSLPISPILYHNLWSQLNSLIASIVESQGSTWAISFSNCKLLLEEVCNLLQSCRRFASMIVHGAIHGWLGQSPQKKSLDKSKFPLFHHAWRFLLKHVYKRNGYKSRNKELLYEIYANCSLYILKLLLIKSLQLT